MQVKVLSWNIWIDGDFDQASDFLKKNNADIIGLQEVKDDDPKRDAINSLKNLGYKDAFGSIEKIWNGKPYRDGPAIFSRYPIINVERNSLSEKDNRLALGVDVEFGGKVLHVFSTHLIHTHQKESLIQKEQAESLIRIIPKERSILMGDFNATPASSTIKLMQANLTDTDKSQNPTWSVYPEGCHICNPQKIDTRLDYIFVTPDIKVTSFEVGQSRASDHLPITAVVEV